MTGLPSRRGWAGRRAPCTRPAANIVATLSALGLTLGCIDRPVAPSEPNTTNVFADELKVDAIEAIDLLFVVDNSISMADKQALLREAVPQMVGRLLTPDCIDDVGHREPSDGQGCTSYGPEFFSEFRPVDDIHLGVISSSLGGFGSAACSNEASRPDDLDKSRLMPKVREVVAATGEAVPNPTGLGFLAWTGVPEGADPVEAKAKLASDLALHVAAAGESGCGFEAPLEAWYRFLIDPEPPKNIEQVNEGSGSRSVSTGVDTGILEQRAEFLRPGSLVAIVVLSDENDCSVMEGGVQYPYADVGWLLPDLDRRFPVASASCEDDPNDKCCYSCLATAPAGCADSCVRPESPKLAAEDDRANVRCFDNKRRFGVDLLYPTERYVDALSKSTIINSRTGQPVQNPLLAGRSPDRVFFAGIVGVPWQDVATSASLGDMTTLSYRSASELEEFDAAIGGSRWDLLVGSPGGEGVPAGLPLDPFMIESIAPRSGTHPLTGDAIVAPGSSGWSVINGHEYDNSVPFSDDAPSNDDLQYSCIFPLAADAVKTDCSLADACDCGDEPSKQRPLCKASESASASADTTQRYGKAYPPSRVLRVLRGFGENSIVASICPKIMDPSSPSFGYNPAVNAIVDRLADKLNGQCLPRSLTTTDGKVPCVLVEATHEKVACDAGQRRAELTDSARAAFERRMVDGKTCRAKETDEGTLPLCSEFTVCELLQVEDDALPTCFDGTAPEQQEPGYCYIDPGKGPDAGGFSSAEGTCVKEDPSSWDGCINPHVLGCEATKRRILRFVGERTPKPNSTTYVACAGDPASEDAQLGPLRQEGDE